MENRAAALPIVWGSMMLAVVFYAVIVILVVPLPTDRGPFDWFSDPIALGLHVAGFGAFVMAFVLSTVLTRPTPERKASVPSGWVIRWALLESIAIFGLLAAFLTRDPRAFLILGLLSLAGLAMSYPRARPSRSPSA